MTPMNRTPRGITLPTMRCHQCGHSEPTTVCRWCSTDKLAALCAKVAQDMAGPRPPLVADREAA